MEEKFLEYLTKLENALTEYGPQAAELTLEVARVGAIQTVLIGVVCLILFVCGSFVAHKSMAKVFVEEDGSAVLPACIGIMVAIFSSAPAFMYITNLYAWIGMFRPEIYLISKAIQ